MDGGPREYTEVTLVLLKDLIARQKGIISVSPTQTARDAAKVMDEANVGCAAVMEGDRLVGIFTERDLVRRVLVKNLDVDQVRVSEVMTVEIVSGSPNDNLPDSETRMRQSHIRHLPVLDEEGKVLGLLSIRDLLREQTKELREYIALREG